MGIKCEEQTDRELMQAYAQGEIEAFQVIYHRHHSRVYAYLSRRLKAEHVDEVFQNVFLKFHQKRQSYDPKFELPAWLYTITKSCLIDFIRKRQRYSELLSEVLEEENKNANSTPTPEDQQLTADWQNHVQGKSKAALSLRYEQGLEFEEMARALKVAPSNARKLVSRGLAQLRQVFKGDQDE